jgi:hypothetical protein
MKSHDHQNMNQNPLADSAGVPWQGRSFSENQFAEDDGTASPELISAIQKFHLSGDATNVFLEFSKSRLLIPLIAELVDSEVGPHGQTVDKSADLSIVTVQTPDQQTGLPVFSSVDTMKAWNTDARPVPSDAVRAALSAATDGTTRIILDPGSKTEFAFRRAAIAALAQQKSWRPPHLDESVIGAFRSGIAKEESITDILISSLDPMSRLEGPEIKIELRAKIGLDKEQLEKVLHRITQSWAASKVIAAAVDSMALVVQPAK